MTRRQDGKSTEPDDALFPPPAPRHSSASWVSTAIPRPTDRRHSYRRVWPAGKPPERPRIRTLPSAPVAPYLPGNTIFTSPAGVSVFAGAVTAAGAAGTLARSIKARCIHGPDGSSCIN